MKKIDITKIAAKVIVYGIYLTVWITSMMFILSIINISPMMNGATALMIAFITAIIGILVSAIVGSGILEVIIKIFDNHFKKGEV